MMRNWSWITGLLLIVAAAEAHWDFLLGVRDGRAAVILPHPHPLQNMSLLFGQYIRELGIEYYHENGVPHLSRASVRTVWVSPGLIGRIGSTDVVCQSGCPNYFTLPADGHEHIRFRTRQPGIYIWDLRVVDAADRNGNPVQDMVGVYRIYLRAGNPHYLYGSVDAPNYQGDLYPLNLTLQIRRGSQTVETVSLPPVPDALHTYMASFAQPSTYTVVAKLGKHLSRRVDNLNLSGGVRADWLFPISGDVNNDDLIDDADLLMVLFAFGTNNFAADANGDGIVDDADLLLVLFNFGASGEGRD
jgi:hypothetical protein